MLDWFNNIKIFSNFFPVPIYWLDLKQKYLGVNNTALKAIGALSYEKDFFNKTPLDLFSPKRAAEIIEHHRGVIRSNVPLFVEESIENISTKKIQFFNAIISPLHQNGEIIGTIGISIDITEEKRKLAHLKKETIFGQLSKIAPFIPANVYWLDVNNTILGVNEQTLKAIGLTSYEEIIGKTVYDLYPEEMAKTIDQHHAESIRTRKTLKHEEVITDVKTGKTKYFTTVKTPIYDDDKVIGSIGISIDITERKKLEEELIQAKKAAESASYYLMTEFVSNMGHDLATPISDVGGIAQLLLHYVDEYPEFKEDFEILATRSEDCEKVRQHILNATSISNLEIKPEKFSISLMLLALEKELSPTIDSKKLKLIIHPLKPKKEDFIVTDRIKFHDILFDLVSNAINFTEEGQVTISVTKEDDLFHIKVSDTGIGIPADKFDYIFQQYTKLSRSNKYGATFKGVGAGLYLAKIRANILNATISVESEVGKGSTFTLSIPTVHSDKKD